MIRVGDKVKCIDEYDPYYGVTGVVSKIDSPFIDVNMDNDNSVCTFNINKLQKEKTRGFEQISSIKTYIPLPTRGTTKSAGYDIYVMHPEVYRLLTASTPSLSLSEAWEFVPKVNGKAIVIKPPEQASIVLPTGIKSYMMPDEFLLMTIRSSSGIKVGIRQSNPPSIIDADYYNNPDNEGHIMFAIKNNYLEFDEPVLRIAQGVFCKYFVADDDDVTTERSGGIGSTND